MASAGKIARIFLGQKVIICSHVTPLNKIGFGYEKFYSSAPTYENIKTNVVGTKKNVGIIQLNRPKVLNALSKALIVEIGKALKDFNANGTISAIIITGNEKSFTAGADIEEMHNNTLFSNKKPSFLDELDEITKCGKPIIAAVNGYAFGGGCELAMMCDIIYAGENAKFAQPQIKIGSIPGLGGTQRLPRYVGKSKAMEMVLTGAVFNAREAKKMGLVSRVFPTEKLLDEAIKLAERIGTHSPLIVKMAKEAVNLAYETTLYSGIEYEKSIFCGTFATEDRKEGMTAFIEKRPPVFKNN